MERIKKVTELQSLEKSIDGMSLDEVGPDLQSVEKKVAKEVFSSVEHDLESISFFLDIEEKAIIEKAILRKSARDYRRNMRRIDPAAQRPRYLFLNTWASDGIRVFRL